MPLRPRAAQPPRRITAVAALSLLLGLAAAPRRSAGQTPRPPSPGGTAHAMTGLGTLACGSAPVAPFPSPTRRETRLGCVADGARLDAFGRAVGGVVQASAAVWVPDTSRPEGPPGTPRVRAVTGTTIGQGVWQDRLTITGGSATSVDISLRWTGRVEVALGVAGDAVAGALSTASWGFGAYDVGFGQLINPYHNEDQVEMSSAGTGGETEGVMREFLDAQTFTVSLLRPRGGLLSQVLLNHHAHTRAEAGGLAGPGAGTFNAGAWSDMEHTGLITGLLFHDVDGSDVTRDVAYRFENGTRVGPVTPVPEPSTWTLALVGLAGLRLLVRCRAVVRGGARARAEQERARPHGSTSGPPPRGPEVDCPHAS